MKEFNKDASIGAWSVAAVVAALWTKLGTVFAMILLTPIFYVILNFGLSRLIRRFYKSIEFYGILMALTVTFTGAYFYTDYILPISEMPYFFIYHLGHFFEGRGLSEKWSFTFARQVTNAAPYALLLAIGIWAYFLEKSFFKGFSSKKAAPNLNKNNKFSPKLFEKFRHQSTDLFIGIDSYSKKPIYMSEHDQGMHLQVMGSTGFGKTRFAVCKIENHIKNGRGGVFFDGKGSKEFYFEVLALARKHGREKDLYFVSIAYPEISSPINMLRRGSSTEIKDKLIGSQIWTEEYYKKAVERALMIILNALLDCGIVPTLERVYEGLDDPKSWDLKGFKNKSYEKDFQTYVDEHKRSKSDYSGFLADLVAMIKSDFGHLFEEHPDGVDILDAYNNNKIIFIQMPTARFEETAKRLGRMILQDIKTACSYVESEYLPKQKKFFPIIIDEFASFATQSFIDFINKARSSGMGTTIMHQSMGDLKIIGDHYPQQVSENTNGKIFFRIDDPETIDYTSKQAGTYTTIKRTYETHRRFFMRYKTGGASEREVDEYKIEPNEFRNLGVGEGVVYIKTHNQAYKVQFDYIEPDISGMEKEFSEKRKLAKEKLTSKLEKKVAHDDEPKGFSTDAFSELKKKAGSKA